MTPNDPFSPTERDVLLTAIVNRGSLKREDAERLFASFENRRSKRNPLLESQWVKTLCAICDALCENRARPAGLFVSLFWIRLYGAITELLANFSPTAELHDLLAAEGKSHPFVAASADVFAACVALRDSLSDDELVFAAFLRQVHAHVYQDGFEYSIERGNPERGQRAALRTKQMVRTTGRHISIDEAHAILDKICLDHSNDDTAIAAAFALKLQPRIVRLGEAMHELDAERRPGKQR